MKTPKLNIMKNNYLKWGLLALTMIAGTALQAQTTSGADNVAQSDKAGVSVKLIDNKGTIKYMQSNNGITTLTSTEAGNKTTTTWQLGGSLVDNTYIDVSGQVFGLDGLELITNVTTYPASTDATSLSTHGTGTGWTLLVRDEATGATKKLIASELVEAAVADDVADMTEETADEIVIIASNIPTAASKRGKIWVYRNGVKLSDLTDYGISANTVTVTGTSDFSIYMGDVFEVQWVK